ncbi:MAG: hypothetical protein ACI914_001148, partial [Candidatus Marivariicella framensis]
MSNLYQRLFSPKQFLEHTLSPSQYQSIEPKNDSLVNALKPLILNSLSFKIIDPYFLELTNNTIDADKKINFIYTLCKYIRDFDPSPDDTTIEFYGSKKRFSKDKFDEAIKKDALILKNQLSKIEFHKLEMEDVKFYVIRDNVELDETPQV